MGKWLRALNVKVSPYIRVKNIITTTIGHIKSNPLSLFWLWGHIKSTFTFEALSHFSNFGRFIFWLFCTPLLYYWVSMGWTFCTPTLLLGKNTVRSIYLCQQRAQNIQCWVNVHTLIWGPIDETIKKFGNLVRLYPLIGVINRAL